MKKMIIASTSTIHGSGYLEYLLPTLETFFVDVKTLLFIPYARPSGISYNDYTSLVKKVFLTINIDVKGIHEFKNPKETIKNAEAIFTGGFTDSEENYKITNLKPGNYVVQVSYLGYQTQHHQFMILDNDVDHDFTLRESAIALGEYLV